MEKIVKQSIKILVFLMIIFFISFITASVSLSFASKQVSNEETFRSFFKTTSDISWREGTPVSADKIKWQGDKQILYFPIWVTEETAKEDEDLYPYQLVILHKFFKDKLDNLEDSIDVVLPEIFNGVSMKLSEIKDAVNNFPELKREHENAAALYYREAFNKELDMLKDLKIQLAEQYTELNDYLQGYKRETQNVVNAIQPLRSVEVGSFSDKSEHFRNVINELLSAYKLVEKYYNPINEKLSLVTNLIKQLEKSNPTEFEIVVNKPKKTHSVNDVRRLLADLRTPKLRLQKALSTVRDIEERLPELKLEDMNELSMVTVNPETEQKKHDDESSDEESVECF